MIVRVCRSGRSRSAIGSSGAGYRALIDGWLEADRRAPRKQRHTVRRIWRRLVDEYGAEVAERTVREYAAARLRELREPGYAAHRFEIEIRAPQRVGSTTGAGEYIEVLDLTGATLRSGQRLASAEQLTRLAAGAQDCAESPSCRGALGSSSRLKAQRLP